MHISANIICKQLKDFVQYKEYNPEIGDSYFATSEKDEDTDDNILKPCIGILIILFFIVGSFLVILITLILMVIYLYTKRWDRKLTKISESIKSNKASKSKIVGIAFTSWILYIYIVILDLLAVNTKHTSIQVPDMLPVLLIIVLVVDCIAMFIIICALVCILSIIICSLCDCCKKRKDEKRYSLCKLYKKIGIFILSIINTRPNAEPFNPHTLHSNRFLKRRLPCQQYLRCLHCYRLHTVRSSRVDLWNMPKGTY